MLKKRVDDEIMSQHLTESGGIKEVSFTVSGAGFIVN